MRGLLGLLERGSAQVAVRSDLVEVVMTIGFRERRSVMVGRAIVAAETACSPKFPHSAHLAPAGSSCMRTW